MEINNNSYNKMILLIKDINLSSSNTVLKITQKIHLISSLNWLNLEFRWEKKQNNHFMIKIWVVIQINTRIIF